MKILQMITLILLIIGGVNWGLVGLFRFDPVAYLFGFLTTFSRIIYVLVGISAIYKLITLTGSRVSINQ